MFARPAGPARQGPSPRVLIAETGPMAERVRVHEIGDGKGRWLARIARRGSGPLAGQTSPDAALVECRSLALVFGVPGSFPLCAAGMGVCYGLADEAAGHVGGR